MDVENSVLENEPSKTPELDADMPKKGIPRLVIEKLVLENFKSYAGVKEIGPFHKNFTSIVGPNGSGKSNVIDAMLFVFGKRASKLRLKKVSELIHNSANVAPAQFARVSVHFQDIIDIDDEHYEPVPNSLVVITRVAYKNNSSKYFINNKASNATDVTTLLRKRGIDLDNNRFLILQGEVEQISLMKPKKPNENEDGLLEYLEDIIGSAKYVPMIESKETEVEKLSDSRGEVLNRVKIVEKERNTLEAGKKEADLFLSKERELAREQGLLYQWHIHGNEVAYEKLRQENEGNEEQLTSITESLKEYTEKIQTVEANLTRVTKECEDLTKQLQACKAEYDEYESKDIQYHENMSAQKARQKKLKAKREKNEKDVNQKQETNKRLEDSLEDYATNIEKAKEEKVEIEKQLNSILQKFREEIDRLKEKKAEIEESLQPLQEKYTVEIAVIDEKKTEFEMLNNKLTQATQELKELTEWNEKNTTKFNELMMELEQKKIEIARNESQIEQKKQQLYRYDNEVNRIQSELRKKRQQLQEKRSQLKERKSSNSVLSVLQRAAKPQGELEYVKVFGRLGDLGEIDSKYDVAVSTASSALDYIVVRSAEDAQKCIEYLKKYRAGRARFLVLDEMKKYNNRIHTPFNCPPNSTRLFDLITVFDEQFLPAFYFALQDTLVTSSLDIASKLAYVKNDVLFRVVTLSGQIIEKSGTMSGGGRYQRHGLMKLKNQSGRQQSVGEEVTEEMVNELDNAVRVLSSQFNKAQQDSVSTKTEIDKMEESLPQLKLLISKLEIDVNSLRDQLEKKQLDLTKAKKEFDSAEKSKSHIEELQTVISREENKLKGIKSEMKGYQDKIKAVDRDIELVGGDAIQKKRRDLKAAIDRSSSLQKELSSTKVKIRSNQKSIQQMTEENTRLDKEIADTEQAIAAAKAQFEIIEKEAERVLQAFENARNAHEEKDKELNLVTKEYEELKKTNTEQEEKISVLKKKKEELSIQMKQLTDEKESWVTKLQALRKKTWENTRELDEEPEESEEKPVQPVEPEKPTNQENPNETTEGPKTTDGSSEPLNTPVDTDNRMEIEEEDPLIRIIPDFSIEDIESVDKARVERNILRLEAEKDNMKKNVNLSAIAESLFRAKDREYKKREKELDDITAKRDTVRKEYDDLRKKRLTDFMEGFNQITLKLKEMYQMITLGGDAELELVDSLDPFSEGIVFSVRPPKKSWKNISNLSGGEKTLSSLALVFALHHYKPTPLYIMDEIDAALDFRNVSIVAHYIKERTKNAQFIVISLRNNMFELADRLVGIYKTDNCTDSVSINPAELCKHVK